MSSELDKKIFEEGWGSLTWEEQKIIFRSENQLRKQLKMKSYGD